MRKIILLLALLLSIVPGVHVIAQDGTITIDPATGEQGTPFVIDVTGLTPNQTYSVELTHGADSAVVFTTNRTTDGSGRLMLNISTSPSDPPGIYEVSVKDGDTVVASGSFELTGSEPPADDVPQSTERAFVEILPESGTFGSTFIVLVSQLEPGEVVTVTVTERMTGDQVYDRIWTANDSGRFDVRLFTTEDDPAGVYDVEVIAENGEVVGAASFEINEPIGRNATVTVTPQSAPAGTSFEITGTDLAPFADLFVEIVHQDSGETAYETGIRATVDGELQLTFDSAAPPARTGTYNVIVSEAGTTVGETTLTITEGTAAPDDTPAASISVSPENTTLGDSFTVDVTGLAPDSAFTLAVVLDSTGETVYSTERLADAAGRFNIILATEEGDETGAYSINILQDGQVVASGSVNVEGMSAGSMSSGVTVNVAPADAEPGKTHIITAAGLEPGENVTIRVQYGDNTLYETAKTADVNGNIALSYTSADDAQSGSYDVQIVRSDGATTSAVLTLSRDVEQTVTLNVTPDMGATGTTHFITASGLNPDEVVNLIIQRNGTTIYNVERTADVNGNVVLTLTTSEDDEPGAYDVRLQRGKNTVATASMNVTEPDVVEQPDTTSDVEVSISPDSGPVGTQYTIDISGLNANETITVNVLYGDNVVFGTQRTADVNGFARVIITSDQSDPAGNYTVDVARDSAIVASTSFAINGEDTMTEPDSFAGEVVITPTAGPTGTNHAIVINGLEPNEIVGIVVEYDGNVVYSTETEADGSGQAALALQSEPSDMPGDYTVRVLREEDQIASATLTITSDTQTAPPVTADDVQISIVPPTGPTGTSHAVTVSGLQPNETVTLDVLFNGEVDYTTQRQADENGEIRINLIAAEGDPTGTYTVNVVRDGAAVATADLVVEAPDTDTPQVVVPPSDEDEIIQDTLSSADTDYRYRFSGNQGEMIIITLKSDDFDSYLYLLDPSGTEIATNDDASGTNAIIGPLVLPESGEYTVVATSFGIITGTDERSGDFTLMLDRIETTALPIAEPQRVELHEGAPDRTFRIEAQIGDIISVATDSDQTIDSKLTLINPSGVTVFEDDDGGEGFDPEINRFAVTVPGTYLLRLEAYTPGEAGTVEVMLEQETARALDNSTQTIRINTKQTSDIVRMQGVAGETVQLHMALVAGDASDVSVTVTQGDMTLMSYQTMGLPDDITLSFVVPEDGTLAIIVESPSSNGVLDLSITR